MPLTLDDFDKISHETPVVANIRPSGKYLMPDFYDAGGVANEGLSPLIKPLGLDEQEKQDLVQFLESLTGSNVDALVADAFAAPIGDIRKGDPNWVHGSDVEVQ